MPEQKMKEVVATRTGLKNGRIILEGEVFEVPEGSKSKWYRDTNGVKPEKSVDKNSDGKLDKSEILKWFEENNIEVDASLGIAKLREAYAAALESIGAPKDQQLNQPE